jgi:hypothetical protein
MVLLAASQLQLGQVDDARRTLDSFHAQWASADPDNPLLQQAKAVQEKLATYPVRGSPR